MVKIIEGVTTVVAMVGIMLLLSLILSLPVYWLWNGCLVGAVAGVSTVTWLQAWGISILSSILFKSNSASK
jgi:hypothetical protein